MNAGITNGIFNNSNMSATDTTVDPYAVFNYDGNRIFKQLKDLFGNAGGTWQASHGGRFYIVHSWRPTSWKRFSMAASLAI